MEDKVYNIKPSTAQKFIRGLGTRYERPASVFCSRELESGLNEYVKAQREIGNAPSDDELKAEARRILGVETTAAEDKPLLEKFKAMHGLSSPSISPSQIPQITEEQILAEFDAELDTMDLSPDSLGALPEVRAGSDTMVGVEGLVGKSVEGGETNIAGWEITPGVLQNEDTQQAMGIAREYAEMYRVSAATASPLRRRATERMAEKRGFSAPEL
jgi:hypothetical protein